MAIDVPQHVNGAHTRATGSALVDTSPIHEPSRGRSSPTRRRPRNVRLGVPSAAIAAASVYAAHTSSTLIAAASAAAIVICVPVAAGALAGVGLASARTNLWRWLASLGAAALIVGVVWTGDLVAAMVWPAAVGLLIVAGLLEQKVAVVQEIDLRDARETQTSPVAR